MNHNFRNDLQGMRGIAVLAVVLFHVFPSYFPGGYLGVDVFFVLSGFFISSALFGELNKTGNMNLLEFWARRIRRILPLATLVLVTCCLLSWALGDGFDLAQEGRRIRQSALYTVNWNFANDAINYFDQDSSHSIVQHYWSLAVEEQFYAIWPLMLMGAAWLAARFKISLPATLMFVTVSLLFVSIFSYFYVLRLEPSYAFFSSTTRAWQLLAGALAALSVASPRFNFQFAKRTRTLMLGGLLLLLVLPLDVGLSAGLNAMFATFFAVSIVVCAPADGTDKFLDSKVLVGLGNVSYGWYLWHWPLLKIFSSNFETMPVLGSIVAVLLALVLAIVTFKWVETPFRYSKWFTDMSSRALALGLALTLLSAGSAQALREIGKSVFVPIGPNSKAVSLAKLSKDRSGIYANNCHLDFFETQLPTCDFGAKKGTKIVLLFGDSHAAHYFDPLEAAASKSGWRVVSRTKSACSAADISVWHGKLKREYRECHEWRKAVFAEIESLKPDVVIFASSANATVYDDKLVQIKDIAKRKDHFAAGELTSLLKMSPFAKRVLVLRDLPILPEVPARCLMRKGGVAEDCTWELKPEMLFPISDPKNWPSNVSLLDMFDIVCPNNTCKSVHENKVTKYDRGHLTASYALTLAEHFVEQLK